MGKQKQQQTSELYLWSQRLVDFLHQPGESTSIHGLGQGITRANRLLETERADHLGDKHSAVRSKRQTKKKKHICISLLINDLFSFGCEFLVSESLPEGRAINSQQLENNNTSVLGCTSSQDSVHI